MATMTSRRNAPAIASNWHDDARTILQVNRILLLRGDPGVGKTHFAHLVSHERCGQPAQELTADLQTDKYEFWGNFSFDSKTIYNPGPLAIALQQGSVFTLSEFGILPQGMLGAVLELRDSDTVRNPVTKELINIPNDFRIVLTANPANVQCRQHGEALQSLLDDGLGLDIDPVDAEFVASVLDAHFPEAKQKTKQAAIYWWGEFREVADGGREKDNVPLNIRSTKQFVALVESGMAVTRAAELAYVNKFWRNDDLFHAAKMRLQMGR